MIAVATTEDELGGVCARLTELGVGSMEIVAPSEVRRVVLAEWNDDGAAEPVSLLRADGVMAVTRPDRGARLEAWEQDSRPITFGQRLSLCPAWSEHDRRNLPGLVELGPGGFGNGNHPTTQLLIEDLVRRLGGGERVLDVGCGSGVLGLCALELGAGRVVAVDINAGAVDATRRNAALNGMEDRLCATDAPLDDIDGTFDVVLANIARAGIVGLASQLVGRVAPGGSLAVSGISPRQSVQVAAFLRPLVEVERRTMGEWAAVVLTNS